MKKYLFSALALSGMLFMNSCSQDGLVPEPNNGDFVNASFTIGTTEGIGTRAAGLAENVDQVTCAVFDANNDEMTELRLNLPVVNGKATYEVRLAKGQNYRVAFFAYDKDANAYDVTDMKSIKVLGNQASNMDNRDAFTAYTDINAADLTSLSNIDRTVTLYRPFAQLNLGINDAELEAARKAGVAVTNTQIKVSNVYNAFSAFSNTVAADATLGEMTFAMNGIPQEKLVVDGEEYNYLALNYLLVGDMEAEKSLADVEFVWATADGKTNTPATNFINIPVQRNYRTNIIGKLLTTPSKFNIVVDPIFEGNKTVEIETAITKSVSTAAELQAAINAAPVGRTIIKLAESIIEYKTITVNQKKDIEILIDGQNHALYTKILVNGGSVWGGKEGLTIQNATLAPQAGADIITIGERTEGNTSRYAHNVTISNCKFDVSIYGAEASIANTVAIRAYQANDVTVVNCKAETAFHSFAQITGGNNIKFEQVTSNCVRGISLGAATNCVISNCNITATGSDKYGVRHNADSSVDALKVINSKINAFIPVVVRKTNNTAIESYKLAFEGANTLTKGAEYEVAIAAEEYDAVGKTLTALDNVTVEGADVNWTIFK